MSRTLELLQDRVCMELELQGRLNLDTAAALIAGGFDPERIERKYHETNQLPGELNG